LLPAPHEGEIFLEKYLCYYITMVPLLVKINPHSQPFKRK